MTGKNHMHDDAQPEQQPFAYFYERATARTSSGKPALWQNELTFGKPDTHEFIRNVQPLYAAQPPAAPVEVSPEVMDRRRRGLPDYEKPPLGQPPSWLQEQEKKQPKRCSAGTVQHTCRVLDGGIDGPYNEPDPACCSGRALEARDTLLRVLKRYGGEPYTHVAIDAAWNAAVAILNEPQGAWQPIETAPKDGTPVIIAECTELSNGSTNWYIDTAVNYFETDIRSKDVWFEREGSEIVCDEPTHWQPLPTPPLSRPPRQTGEA